MFLNNTYRIPQCLGFRLCCAAVALVVLLVLFWGRPEQRQAGRVSVASDIRKTFISVSGDVKYPGMYAIDANVMAGSVIKMALPLRCVSSAELQRISAVPLANGDELVVVSNKDSATVKMGTMPVAQRLIMNIPLDILRMSEADFELLPGIGGVTARRITEYRQKNGGLLSVEDLLQIEGIGDRRYQKLKQYFN